MTNSKINMGILVSYNTSLDFVNITASVNNGPRSVYLHHIGTFQVYTSFGNDGPDHLASYGANHRSLKFGPYITYIASKPKAHGVIT